MNNLIAESISVIIPSKNDSINIYKHLSNIETYLSNYFEQHEIILVSNGSTKNDINKIDKLVLDKQNIKHIKLTLAGKGNAIREGIKLAKYDNILFSDADFSVSINEINNFFNKGSLISDLVIGNRRGRESQNLNSPYKRLVAGAIFVSLVNSIFKFKIEDSQCGFKAFNKKIFADVMFSENGFVFDVEMIYIAFLNNYKITEVPVKYVHQENSSVSVVKDSFKMIVGLIRIYSRHRRK